MKRLGSLFGDLSGDVFMMILWQEMALLLAAV
jgi:hypothetical protein